MNRRMRAVLAGGLLVLVVIFVLQMIYRKPEVIYEYPTIYGDTFIIKELSSDGVKKRVNVYLQDNLVFKDLKVERITNYESYIRVIASTEKLNYYLVGMMFIEVPKTEEGLYVRNLFDFGDLSDDELEPYNDVLEKTLCISNGSLDALAPILIRIESENAITHLKEVSQGNLRENDFRYVENKDYIIKFTNKILADYGL